MLWAADSGSRNRVVRAPLDASSGGSVSPNRSAPKASGGGRKAGGEAPLGNTAKSVDQPVSVQAAKLDQKKKDAFARITRTVAFRLQRRAAKLLPDERVGLCRWAVRSRDAGVNVQLTEYGSGVTRASYAGLQTCGSVWLCPCCGRRISETRRGELNAMLAWAREQGLQPVMITLTARHGIRDQLEGQLDAMKRAKQRLRQRRDWRRIKGRIAGTVTATEVTHGRHGWHTHFHEIVLVEAGDEAEAIAVFAGLDRVWRACLLGVGLSGGRAAWQVQGAAAAGRYVGKWGAGEEMTLTGSKQARGNKGRTPLQLLSEADGGDEHAAQLWRTYGKAFKGRRQLVWSPGLKARAGIDDTSDAEAAQDDRQEDAQTVSHLLRIEHQFWVGTQRWLGARHRRGRVLDAAETGGAAAAEAVVRDGERDEREVDVIGVIDDSVPMSDWMPQLKSKKPVKEGPSESGPPPLTRAEFDAAIDTLMFDETVPQAASPPGAQA